MQQRREGVGAKENVAFWRLVGVRCMGRRGQRARIQWSRDIVACCSTRSLATVCDGVVL
jgi:hypothetical protein